LVLAGSSYGDDGETGDNVATSYWMTGRLTLTNLLLDAASAV
jgi:hypothetical protein